MPAASPSLAPANARPRIAVLLPTFNGAAYLREQIESIRASEAVEVHIFAHDDGSTDGTLAILSQLAGPDLTVLGGPAAGSAAANFFFLIRTAPWDGFDYVALSDQDDIWNANKLSRAVDQIRGRGLDVYASDVLAFWPDGRERYVRKSQPQRTYDHYFEAGGPGNTHVYTIQTARRLRSFLDQMPEQERREIALHDWLIYAYCRQAGLVWGIDQFPGLRYRQHGSNVLGAASGPSAIADRLQRAFGPWYLDQVRRIGRTVGATGPVADFLRTGRLSHLLRLLLNLRQTRRRASHSFALAVILLAGSARLRRQST